MKIRLDVDSEYGVYNTIAADDDESAQEVDVTEEQAERWRRVMADYEKVQAEMRETAHIFTWPRP